MEILATNTARIREDSYSSGTKNITKLVTNLVRVVIYW